MGGHFLNLALYAVAISIGLSLVMRDRLPGRTRFAGLLALGMVVIAVVVGWIMYALG